MPDGVLVWADANGESPKAGSIFSQDPRLSIPPKMIASNNIAPTLERHCSKYFINSLNLHSHPRQRILSLPIFYR